MNKIPPIKRPEYQALNSNGDEYTRPAQRVSELPQTKDRTAALLSAKIRLERAIGQSFIQPLRYGMPVYHAFGMTPTQAKLHARASLLLTPAGDLPLDYVPTYSDTALETLKGGVHEH